MTRTASNYDRMKRDQYFTEHWVPEAVLDVVRLSGLTCDPCAGGWNVVEALRNLGVACEGFDIDPELERPPQPWALPPRDFLTFHGFNDQGTPYRNYVFNPPYGLQGRLAVRFLEHALMLTEALGGKVLAIAMPVDFDSGSTRRHLFNDHPAYDAEYKLTKRLRWTNIKQKANGPKENHTVHVWDWSRGTDRPPIKGYLPRQKLRG